MRKISKPLEDTRSVYRSCVKHVQNAELNERLLSVEDRVVEEAERYEEAGEQSTLHATTKSDGIDGIVTRREMEALYKGRLAERKLKAYEIYQRIKAGAPNGKCPYCAHRDVATLDHYLPIAKFSVFAVTPINLVPGELRL